MAFAMHIPLTDKYKYAVESPVNVTTLNAKTEWSPLINKNRTTGGLFREEVQTLLLYGR